MRYLKQNNTRWRKLRGPFDQSQISNRYFVNHKTFILRRWNSITGNSCCIFYINFQCRKHKSKENISKAAKNKLTSRCFRTKTYIQTVRQKICSMKVPFLCFINATLKSAGFTFWLQFCTPTQWPELLKEYWYAWQVKKKLPNTTFN